MKRFLVLIMFLFILTGCSKETYDIGFVGSLSIKQSQLSVDARNAVQLYIDEVNSANGINGHQLNLVIKDDQNDITLAPDIYESFMEEEIELIFGNMTSNFVNPILEYNSDKLLFITPSVSSFTADNLDDYLLRTAPLLNGQAKTFIGQLDSNQNENVLIIYDLMNEEYTLNLVNKIDSLVSNDKSLTFLAFDSRTDQAFDVGSQIDFSKYDSALFISQAIDTASFVQSINDEYFDQLDLYSVSWSMTSDLVENGGRKVEGMRFIGFYQPAQPDESYLEFEEAYLKRYAQEPSFIAFFAYDTIRILVKGIEEAKSDHAKEVKEAILNIKEFDGLYQKLIFDEFGDAERDYMIYVLINGEFVPVE